jgi:hypothetical protein
MLPTHCQCHTAALLLLAVATGTTAHCGVHGGAIITACTVHVSTVALSQQYDTDHAEPMM